MSGLEELSREELIALVVQLREANAVLEQRVRRLERHASHNSGNSSCLPPSTDDLPGWTKPARALAANRVFLLSIEELRQSGICVLFGPGAQTTYAITRFKTPCDGTTARPVSQ